MNKEVRGLKTVVRWLSKTGVVRIPLPDITDALKQKRSVAGKDPLTPPEIAQLFEACRRHDAATFKLDRQGRNDTKKHRPVFDIVWFTLMSGVRIEEVWVTPDTVLSGDAWRRLRKTSATYLVCAPGIYGAASQHMASARLGHSEKINKEYYAGLLKIDAEAKTLEQAMGLAPIPKAAADSYDPSKVSRSSNDDGDQAFIAIAHALKAGQIELAERLTQLAELHARRAK